MLGLRNVLYIMGCITFTSDLARLSEILTDLLGTPTPESLLDNIGLVYELLSESTCAGFPKLTDTTKLKPFLSSTVIQPNKSDDLLSMLPDNLFGIAEKEKREIPSQSSKKPLLNNKIETQKNEVYIDLIETLSVIFDASGNLMLCNIIGKLNVKSYLSGDANMTISFNQPNGELSQAITHSSVNKSNLPQDIKMQVSPGNFHALSYNLSNIGESVSMPFTLYSSIMPYPQDKMLTLSLKIHCDLPVRHPAMNLVGKIAIPECAVSASGISSLVNITFNHDRKRSEYCFSCPLFPGNSHHTVTVKLILSSWTAAMVFELDKVLLQFEAPMMCHSEIKITDLKVKSVNTSSLQINKWVRYLTFANSYEFYLKDDWFPHTEMI
ncbi:AP-4 complex subunit mu-1-like [Clavelina lepadiformis]|uniref:AP-4 complex subunit mu-1-like n=1 Tax=Clavelina lepadiformis TaxID=159417 RepID=UPI0040426DBC